MGKRDEFIRSLQAKLEQWNAEIDTLTLKADKVTEDLRQEYHEQIESLKEKQAAARKKIEEIQQAGDSAWEDLKTGAELAWSAMGEAIESARSRFR